MKTKVTDKGLFPVEHRTCYPSGQNILLRTWLFVALLLKIRIRHFIGQFGSPGPVYDVRNIAVNIVCAYW